MLAAVHSRASGSYGHCVGDVGRGDEKPTYERVIEDLAAEHDALDDVVAGLDDTGWSTPTPAQGWDVRDSIAHLAYSEELAATATTDPDAFALRLADLVANIETTESDLVAQGRSISGPEVLGWWRRTRARTLEGLRGHDARDRLPWIAGPMSAMSFGTARMMETWAHGQDVVDGLGVGRPATERLRHICELCVQTRRHSYFVRGRDMPDGDVEVELSVDDGVVWSWGASATDSIRGPALDFCLVCTQRRNPADTALEVTGPLACEWIDHAQAFAGAATDQRPASQG